MVTRKQFYEEARKWVGTPWKHQGRNSAGIDCGGLMIVVARDLGLSYQDVEYYAREPTSSSLMNHIHGMLTKLPKNDIIPGTIGIFREGVYPCHIGIFSEKQGAPHIIHSLIKRRKTVEEYFVPQVSGLQLVSVHDFNGVVP